MFTHALTLCIIAIPLGLFMAQGVMALFWGMPTGKDPSRFATWHQQYPTGGHVGLAVWGLLTGVIAWVMVYLPYHAG